MIGTYFSRLVKSTNKRLLFNFLFKFGIKSTISIRKFRKRRKKNIYFPPFLFISVTNNCNFSCQGCWACPASVIKSMDTDLLDTIITKTKKAGTAIFGILGGEPLLYKNLFDILDKYKDVYFILFTNGTFLSEDVALRIKKHGNITPLISLEGNEIVSDERRGGKNVYSKTLCAIENCTKLGIITGVATSVCKSNINELVNEKMIDDLIKLGVHYIWYYIYRPSGVNPCPELALSKNEILQLRKFLVETRPRKPVFLLDSYWESDGTGFCPAVSGISYHINPYGDIEPCPPVQFATDRLSVEDNMFEKIVSSEILDTFRVKVGNRTHGCILMENPTELSNIAKSCNAYDSSGREALHDELENLPVCSCHSIPGEEMPEKHWFYRFAKKQWFFGLGAYG